MYIQKNMGTRGNDIPDDASAHIKTARKPWKALAKSI